MIILSIFLLVSCSNTTNKSYTSIDYFDTVITLNATVNKDSNIDSAWAEIKEQMQDMESKLSVYKENSDIDKFNKAEAGAEIEISETTKIVLQSAMLAYAYTNGAYNPSLFLLSDLWGFTDRFNHNYSPSTKYDRQDPTKELPSEEYIEGFLSLTDFSLVSFRSEGDKYYVTKPDRSVVIDGEEYTMHLDLGGIVKGYATGVIRSILNSYNIDYGYVSLGSSSLCLLKRDEKGQKWMLSLKDPTNPDSIYLKTPVISSYVSTSGNYEQYYEINNKRYCHIINPFTGYPVENNRLSASCIHDFEGNETASLVDAYSTALMVLDLDSAKQLISSRGLKGYIALKDGETYKVYTNDNNAEITGNYEAIA